MKWILLLSCISFSSMSFSQQAGGLNVHGDSVVRARVETRLHPIAKDSSKQFMQMEPGRQRKSDSLAVVLHSALNISKEKATSVMQIISQSIRDMDANAKASDITGEEKVKRFKHLAKERDDKIAALLTEEQINALKAIVGKNRQQPVRHAPTSPAQ